MSSIRELKGITWSHSRGFTPLIAASQRFSELFPEVSITWKKRSLQEFADFPLEKLVEHYDLLIIDHPWVGRAASTKSVVPLDQHLSEEFLLEQGLNSTGLSHQSYHIQNHQWALAIDAATPVASYRKDLIQKNGINLPQTLEEVITLAKQGKVAVPAIPIDLLMNFYMFCIAAGEEPFLNQAQVIDHKTGILALEMMKELYANVDQRMFSCNPIQVAELMTTTDEFWYCPFSYGYSNYSRQGYANKLLHYTNLVTAKGHTLRSTLGGTGIAISASTSYLQDALKFTEWICTPNIQSTLYTENGGQPGHRSAWIDERCNYLTNDYFKDTLPTLSDAYMRPRYDGYLEFQDHAGLLVYKYLKYATNALQTLEEMDQLYRKTRR